MRYCLSCMCKQIPGTRVCPQCGTPYSAPHQTTGALSPGTILMGKYQIGQVLGQGGFGITYIGMDLLLERKVAIKECFPVCTGLVSRRGADVVWNSTVNQRDMLANGLNSFLAEARKLAMVDDIPCVVKVRDYFTKNNTAYIVMDYVEGETLQQKLEREGPMDFPTCVRLLQPVIQALEQVHSYGIIHRDISPDNIMVGPGGQLYLLDLGAAKEVDIHKSDGSIQSSRLVAKAGFSPLEQYSPNGRIGSWTDVYAMAATVYYCCTGQLPPPATSRQDRESLPFLPNLNKNTLRLLNQGMALLEKDRIQSMGDLLTKLVALTQEYTDDEKPPVRQRHFFMAAAIFGVELLLHLVTMVVYGNLAVSLLFVGGYALMGGALLQQQQDQDLVAWGCVALALAHWLSSSVSGVMGAVTLLGCGILLQCHRLGHPGWLERYWLLSVAMLCVYLVMLLTEFLHFPSVLLESIATAALALVLYEFSGDRKNCQQKNDFNNVRPIF